MLNREEPVHAEETQDANPCVVLKMIVFLGNREISMQSRQRGVNDFLKISIVSIVYYINPFTLLQT